jgi:hypothetical protein
MSWRGTVYQAVENVLITESVLDKHNVKELVFFLDD